MEISEHQLWRDTKHPENGAFVCAFHDGTVWYKQLLDDPLNSNRRPVAQAEWRKIFTTSWQRAPEELFKKRYEYTKHDIKSGTYWKSKANQEKIKLHGIATRGMDIVLVCFLMREVSIEQFYCQYEPMTLDEQAHFIYDNIKRPDPPTPSRLETIEKDEEPE